MYSYLLLLQSLPQPCYINESSFLGFAMAEPHLRAYVEILDNDLAL
jgi:hypothetical protein